MYSEAGRAPYTQLSGSAERSFLDHMLLETERVHGRVRRYTAPDEFPFFPEAVPPPELPVDLDAPALLHPCAVNLNAQIRAVYERRALPAKNLMNHRTVLEGPCIVQNVGKMMLCRFFKFA